MVVQAGHPPGRIRPPQVDPASRHRHPTAPFHQHATHLFIPDQQVIGPLQGDLSTQGLHRLQARQEGQQSPATHRPPGFAGDRDRNCPGSADPGPVPPSPTIFLTVRYHDHGSSPISSAGVVLCGTRDRQSDQRIWCSQRAFPQVQVSQSLSKRCSQGGNRTTNRTSAQDAKSG